MVQVPRSSSAPARQARLAGLKTFDAGCWLAVVFDLGPNPKCEVVYPVTHLKGDRIYAPDT